MVAGKIIMIDNKTIQWHYDMFIETWNQIAENDCILDEINTISIFFVKHNKFNRIPAR